MNVKRKTVRFQDSLSDLAVYDAISDYKKYGYRSESHMVIEAVRRLIKDGSSELDPDTLADKIAERLAENLRYPPLQNQYLQMKKPHQRMPHLTQPLIF